MSFKNDLFCSTSHFALGRNGLNHYEVKRMRADMDELVKKAENEEGKYNVE